MAGEIDRSRAILRISGADRESFLQGLVTNDVRRLKDGPVYAALLTPQGKTWPISRWFRPPTRSRWTFTPSSRSGLMLVVDLPPARRRGHRPQRLGGPPRTGRRAGRGRRTLRHPALGWRPADHDRRRAAAPHRLEGAAGRTSHPRGRAELRPDDSYILEAGRSGCTASISARVVTSVRK